MRRMLMALAALTLSAAVPTLARAASSDELAPMSNVQEFKLHRYAFDRMGRSANEMSAIGCVGGQPGTVTAHRTRGDIAAAVFSAGWYTPVHVTIDCTAAMTGR